MSRRGPGSAAGRCSRVGCSKSCGGPVGSAWRCSSSVPPRALSRMRLAGPGQGDRGPVSGAARGARGDPAADRRAAGHRGVGRVRQRPGGGTTMFGTRRGSTWCRHDGCITPSWPRRWSPPSLPPSPRPCTRRSCRLGRGGHDRGRHRHRHRHRHVLAAEHARIARSYVFTADQLRVMIGGRRRDPAVAAGTFVDDVERVLLAQNEGLVALVKAR